MVCPDDCAVDHVGGAIPTGHLGQGLQHRIEHPGLHPAPVAPEDAVPLPIFIGQVTPLRSGPRDPHHPFKIGSIIARRSAAASSLRWQKRSDQCPFLIRNTDPFAQVCLPKSSLESIRSHPVKLCPRNLIGPLADHGTGCASITFLNCPRSCSRLFTCTVSFRPAIWKETSICSLETPPNAALAASAEL